MCTARPRINHQLAPVGVSLSDCLCLSCKHTYAHAHTLARTQNLTRTSTRSPSPACATGGTKAAFRTDRHFCRGGISSSSSSGITMWAVRVSGVGGGGVALR